MSRYDLEIDDRDRDDARGPERPGPRPTSRYTPQGRQTPEYAAWDRARRAHDAERHQTARPRAGGKDERSPHELLEVLERTMAGQDQRRAQLRAESERTGVPYVELLKRAVRDKEAREQRWREEGRDRRQRVRERSGHRREYDAREPRRSQQDRIEGLVVDVAVYRAVAYRDASERHFDAHPYTTRRGVNAAIREGLVEERKVDGPKGKTFTVLTATRQGAEVAGRVAERRGWDAEQRMWSVRGRAADLRHDAALYRAVQLESEKLRACGYEVRRVRIDAELRSEVASRTERARSQGRDPEEASRRAASELELPVQQGKVVYPDAQIEYRDADGRLGRTNVELATEHYRAGSVQAKASAGFRMYATAGRAATSVRQMLSGGRKSHGGRPYEVYEI